MHFPTLPNPKFAGKTGPATSPTRSPKWTRTSGEMLDAIDELGIRDNTIVVFTSDNGPERPGPWRGSSGPWRGYYFTHMEGSLRVPFIIRWPGRFPRAASATRSCMRWTPSRRSPRSPAPVPKDRPIDGVDQTDFLLGKSEQSSREGFPVFVADRWRR